MRLVVSSDWHGDAFTNGFERYDDLCIAQSAMLKELDKPDTAFLFLGDLTDPFSRNTHLAVANAVKFARTLNEWDVPNYWLVGNHDVIGDIRGTHTLMALEQLGDYTCVLSKPELLNADFGLFPLPFTAPNHSYDPAAVVEACKAPDLVKVVAGHLNIEGIEPGSETTAMARGREVFWPEDAISRKFPKALWLNGHYHRQQVHRGIHIPGSPLRLAHDEESNIPGFLIFEL